MESEWSEVCNCLQDTTIFCTGLAGFGNTVPEANQKLNHFLQQYPQDALKYVYEYIVKLVDLIIHDLEESQAVEEALNGGRKARNVSLCYMRLALYKLISSQFRFVDESLVRKSIETILHLPSSYFQTPIRTIASCIISTQSIGSVLSLVDLFDSLLLCHCFTEQELMDYGMFQVWDIVPDSGLDTFSLIEFNTHSVAYWLNELTSEIRRIQTTTGIEGVEEVDITKVIDVNKFTAFWQLIDNMIQKARLE